ncbi:MAG TPA: 3-phosphoshikimate 1-carboxyvinyltransferase [Chitinophagaceae bacterium]|nr:3-phosphoshikimate 1-carboxyvinyltransferase [Chitinophagaceae bacterium]
MKATISPSQIKGTLLAPASKSAMQRACAASLIRQGKSILINPGISADDKAALDIIQQLGATCTFEEDKIIIESTGIQPKSSSINCGESGLSVRMFTSIAALSNEEIRIEGNGSLIRRPLNFFDEVLPKLSVAVDSKRGYLPLSIKGPLAPKDITIDGSLSSQFLTGLLFSFSAAEAKGVTINVQNLNSKPYVDLTLHLLQHFGLKVPINTNYETFYFDADDHQKNKDVITYSIEGDWSGASFLLVAGAINGAIQLKGLDLFSTQGDKEILRALHDAGAVMSISDDTISIQKSRLKAFHFNATDCPDLFPPLVALASYCEGTTVLVGVNRLTHKESNRGLTLQEEFKKMGVDILLQDDLMIIEGNQSIKGCTVHSRHDHRIAMACAVSALGATNDIIIEKAEAVNKSYPNFYEHLQQLGAALSLTDN